MAKKGRRKAMTEDEIDTLIRTIASTPKATRPLVFDQPAASGEEVQKMIGLTAINTFGRQEYLTPLAHAKSGDINFAEWRNKIYQAKQYCIIYNAKLTNNEMENICLAVYKYMRFMSTLPDDTDYQLEETDMILTKLDPPLYIITEDIAWIAQEWLRIQQYLLRRNIYMMGEVRLEALSSRKLSCEPDSAQKQVSEEEEDDISEDGQGDQEEEDIFNPYDTRHATSKTRIAKTGKNCEDKGKSRSTSIIDRMTGGRQRKGICEFDSGE